MSKIVATGCHTNLADGDVSAAHCFSFSKCVLQFQKQEKCDTYFFCCNHLFFLFVCLFFVIYYEERICIGKGWTVVNFFLEHLWNRKLPVLNSFLSSLYLCFHYLNCQIGYRNTFPRDVLLVRQASVQEGKCKSKVIHSGGSCIPGTLHCTVQAILYIIFHGK